MKLINPKRPLRKKTLKIRKLVKPKIICTIPKPHFFYHKFLFGFLLSFILQKPIKIRKKNPETYDEKMCGRNHIMFGFYN